MKNIKRLLALALCVALLAPALALAGTHTSGLFKFETVNKITYLPMSGALHTYSVTYLGTVATTFAASVRDSVTKAVYDLGSYSVAPNETIALSTYAFGKWEQRNKPRQFILTLIDAAGNKGRVEFYQTMVKGEMGEDVILQEEPVWYPDNTICSEGPAFRDMQNPVTDKWYTFSAVDLSKQGRQTFEIIGGNMYVIGEVYVDVAGDWVTVTYHNYYDGKGGNTDNKSEFFTFFRDLASATNVNPEEIGSPYAYGVPFSVREMLEGDTNVLLFVRNVASFRTYPVDHAKFRRYWPNTSDYKERREAMLNFMDR